MGDHKDRLTDWRVNEVKKAALLKNWNPNCGHPGTIMIMQVQAS